MLAVKSYPSEYVDACRARFGEEVAAYRRLAATADDTALESFASLYFSTLVLALEMSFVHRTRAIEGKDGNALNEVRMLATSILAGDGVLLPDRTIAYSPESSVLGLAVGDAIQLDDAQFAALAEAFFAELERKFTS